MSVATAHTAPDVALVSPSFEGGGVERVMLNLANGLAARGLRVDLAVISTKGPYREQVAQGVSVIDLGAARMLAALRPLAAYLRRSRPKAVLSALDYINVATIWANLLAGSPARVVVTTHKYFSVATDSSPLRRERWLLPIAMALSYRRAGAVLAIADAMADDLAATIRLPRRRIGVIANPAVTEELLRRGREPVAHPWFRGGAPVLLSCGRLHEQKDFATLLRAFAEVRKVRDARLIILGEGPERPALESLAAGLGIEDDVDLPGFVPNPYAVMSRADLFVMSSRYEGLPTVLIEAMALGCPVLSTDCPSGPAEILQAGRFGRLVPLGDERGLAQAILTTLDHPIDAECVKARAMDFHVDKVIDRYLEILEL